MPIPTKVTPTTPTTPTTPMTAATLTPAPSPMELKMMELTDQFSRLALRLEANFANKPASAANVPRPFPGAMPRPFGERFSNCIWCDATDHMRQLCPAFMAVLREGKVRYNENRRLVNIATGEELPLNFGRGGQQMIFKQQLASAAAAQLSGSSNVNAITAEPQYATLGSENSVVLTTLYDDGTARHDIIDVEVDEKRKRDDIAGQSGRRVRFRNDETPTPSPPESARSASAPPFAPIPPVPIPHAPMQPPSAQQQTTNPISATESVPTPTVHASDHTKKYRLASGLDETTPISAIGEKLMDTPVSLTLREVFASSSSIATYMHDQTRKRRVPIDSHLESMVLSTAPAPSSVPPIVEINNASLVPLYAAPSGRVSATLNGQAKVGSLLDDGSEVNIMPRRTFDKLDFPIDMDIQWKISSFGPKSPPDGCVGVCHGLPVDIGGVEVKVPVFVVEESSHDLLLGRPWGKMARAMFINEDNGDYVCRIKSPDGRRIVQFVAARANHPRNRSYAREADGTFPVEHLKA